MRKLVLAALAAIAVVCPRTAFAQGSPLSQWSITNTSAAAGTATVSKAAAAGFRHVAVCIHVSIAVGAAVQTPITWVVRDGATGAGTIIWTGVTSALAASGNAAPSAQCGLHLIGTTNTAMTIEFTGAGAANTVESVSLSGYDQ